MLPASLLEGFNTRLSKREAGKLNKQEEHMAKSSFDESKDVTLEELGEVVIGDTKLGVSVKSYNEGPAKLQINRLFKERFNSLGRLTPEEAKGLIPLLQEFVDKYQEEE